jgi:hypothetical protein
MANRSSSRHKNNGKKRPNPAAKKKKKTGVPPKANLVTPLLVSGISTAAIVISGLQGQWHQWWVKWGLIPVTFASLAFGIYEIILIKAPKIRLKNRFMISVSSFILLVGLELFAYNYFVYKWQPPELQEGCQFINIEFGSHPFKERVDELRTNSLFINTAPTGFPVGIPLFRVYVKNNRAFIDMRGGFGFPPSGQIYEQAELLDRTIVATNGLPPLWDTNFSSNAFEIVNARNIPGVQIIYKRPDVIIVNEWLAGYVGSNYYYLCAFNGKDAGGPGLPTPEQLGMCEQLARTNILFKYPAWKHPGEYAN